MKIISISKLTSTFFFHHTQEPTEGWANENEPIQTAPRTAERRARSTRLAASVRAERPLQTG